MNGGLYDSVYHTCIICDIVFNLQHTAACYRILYR